VGPSGDCSAAVAEPVAGARFLQAEGVVRCGRALCWWVCGVEVRVSAGERHPPRSLTVALHGDVSGELQSRSFNARVRVLVVLC
jgi:hypothetical protein